MWEAISDGRLQIYARETVARRRRPPTLISEATFLLSAHFSRCYALTTMTQAIKWLYLVALAISIGSIVFFSFFVAPTVFRVLKPEDAARLQRAVFPNYYLVGTVCAAIGFVAVAVLLTRGAFPTWAAVLSLVLLAGMGVADLWMRQSVMPKMNEVRDRVAAVRAAGREPEPPLDAEWKSMHSLSVGINGAVLLCGLVLLFLVVYRAA